MRKRKSAVIRNERGIVSTVVLQIDKEWMYKQRSLGETILGLKISCQKKRLEENGIVINDYAIYSTSDGRVWQSFLLGEDSKASVEEFFNKTVFTLGDRYNEKQEVYSVLDDGKKSTDASVAPAAFRVRSTDDELATQLIGLLQDGKLVLNTEVSDSSESFDIFFTKWNKETGLEQGVGQETEQVKIAASF